MRKTWWRCPHCGFVLGQEDIEPLVTAALAHYVEAHTPFLLQTIHHYQQSIAVDRSRPADQQQLVKHWCPECGRALGPDWPEGPCPDCQPPRWAP